MPATSELLSRICAEKPELDCNVLETVVVLGIEIAREGREGRKIGTLFAVGDSEAVLNRSKPLILDPLFGHPEELKRVTSHDLRETLKELAQLDGAFVISGDGVAISACRYLDASAEGISLPLGLGSRHVAAASISKQTRTVAVVVSESSVVRVFNKGELICEIIPEIWLMRRYSLHLEGAALDRLEREHSRGGVRMGH
ncbi:MAG TPA: diadenylate cyclase [Tepidisphaeraceae bacterium]|nr:diadenylate cyclase [Tepidisphaeraceae bacterium]